MSSLSEHLEKFVNGYIIKRTDLHAVFGGRRQHGIINATKGPCIFVVSGGTGMQSGYHDWKQDDVFYYFGEGGSGHMEWKGGNVAIRDHEKNHKRLFAWEALKNPKGYLQCLGEYRYHDHEIRRGKGRDGKVRNAIVFHLEAVGPYGNAIQSARELTGSVSAARQEIEREGARKVAARIKGGPAEQTTVLATVRKRDARVIALVLDRSRGQCEGCQADAPFLRDDGEPYLEVHHVQHLADEGHDAPYNAVALCPTCHRRVHYSQDRGQLRRKLRKFLRNIYGSLASASS